MRGSCVATLALTVAPWSTVMTTATAIADPLVYGVRAGVNVASIRGDFAELVDTKRQSGFMAGAFVRPTLAKPLALDVEVLYIQKGFRIDTVLMDDQGNFVATETSHLKLDYFEVPVLLHVALPSWGAVTPYVLAGPTAGFAVKATFRSGNPSVGDTDLSDDLKNVDWGIAGGLGARFRKEPPYLGLEARYGTSFSDLWDIDGNLESINQGFSLTATVSR